MAEETQIIELRQLPIIDERLRAFQREIEERTSEAMQLVCTEDTYKVVKKVRAELTKEFSQLEAQRKEVKRRILEPYEAFDALYKECIATPFARADADLKAKIGEVEGGIKADKEAAARSYFEELCQSVGIDWLDWSRTGIKATMSSTVTALKKQVIAFVDDVKQCLSMIDTMDDRAEILVEYMASLDVTSAVKTVADRKAAIRAQQEQDALRREREAQAQEAAQRVEQAAEAQRAAEAAAMPHVVGVDPEMPTEPEQQPPAQKTYQARFSVYGTLEQLKKLKNYMESEGIRYESI